MPRPTWRRSSPHAVQTRGGFLPGRGREHVPHQPVSSRRYPGRPHLGQGRLADSAARRRRHPRQWVAPRGRMTFPHDVQTREQVMQRPVAA
jgi:hypothetical protein